MTPSMNMTKKELLEYINTQTVSMKKYKKLLARYELKIKAVNAVENQSDQITALENAIKDRDTIIKQKDEAFKAQLAEIEKEVRKRIDDIKAKQATNKNVFDIQLEQKDNLLIDSYNVIQALKKNAKTNQDTVQELADAFCKSVFNVEEEGENNG